MPKTANHKLEEINENDDEIKDEQVLDATGNEPDECQQQLEQAEAKYKRAIADYQNLEKRVREERIGLSRLSNRELLLKFLPILDTLLLAQQHTSDASLGVAITQFLDTLKSEQVTTIKTIGEEFDAYTMEVVTTAPGKDGVVIQEVRPGYLLHDKLLRPAQVIVGAK